MKIVLSGLSFSGKSTVFKALAGKQTQPQKSASGRCEFNIGTLELKDARLDTLARLLNSEKITYPKINLIDIVHLGERASGGIDAANLKDNDALILVVGAFSSKSPAADLKNIEQELILADIQVAQNRLERIAKERKSRPRKEQDQESLLLERCLKTLEEEKLLKDLELSPDELKVLAGFQCLTLKPMLVIANLSEEQINKGLDKQLEQEAQKRGLKVLSLCAKLEAEIEELPEEERPQFLQEMGLEGLAKDKFIGIAFQACELILFFTVVGKEARAWAIPAGTTALGAAGCVHSDMERGFIRAEIINYQDFVDCGSFAKAKEKGLLRLESKEYPVRDGDIINFKFSI